MFQGTNIFSRFERAVSSVINALSFILFVVSVWIYILEMLDLRHIFVATFKRRPMYSGHQHESVTLGPVTLALGYI